MAIQTINRPKKSVPLTEKEIYSLSEFKKDKTWFQASMEAGISREVLDRVISVGSCSEKTYNKLTEKGII